MIRQAVILVGGKGSRLKEATAATPKPLLDVGGRPFVEYLLDEAARHGFTDILMLAGHLGGQFQSRYGGKTWRGSRIRVLCEPEPRGTGGALRFARAQLDEFFLMLNGDTLFDINLRALTQTPQADGVVMALRSGVAGNRFGRVQVDNGVVTGFHEKGAVAEGPINGGIYCVSRAVVDAVSEGNVSLETEIFPLLVADRCLRSVVFDRYFIDMGVPEDLERSRLEVPAALRRAAVFFDRDGVLNVDKNYVHRIEDFEWMPGAREAIRHCNDLGMLVFVVTNQAGVARGYYDETAVLRLHDFMAEELAVVGGHVDAFSYCPHHPEGTVEAYRQACRRRKPAPGMIEDLLADWTVDKAQSILIGDKSSDIAAANLAGVKGKLYVGGDLRSLVPI